MGSSSQGPIFRIKPVSLDLCYLPIISVAILLSRMTSSTFILRQLKPPLLRLHFSTSDVRETTLFKEGEPRYRYKVSTSRPTSHTGNKVTTVSDSRGMPIIVFRWNTYKRDEIDWVKPRQAGPPPVIKRPISAFFKVGRYVFRIRPTRTIITGLWANREYATFEDRGNSYVWTREEHDPNAGPDVLLNLSVRLPCDMFHSVWILSLTTQLFSKSRGPSVVCGRIIEGRVLELYRELTDSPSKALEEACVLSGIFALRYLTRDIAANVEPVDVRFRPYSARGLTDDPSS